MPKLIIIRGPLGVGKTTISKKLAAKIDAEYISIDQIIEEHKLDQATDGQGIPVENFIKGNEIVLPKIKDVLQQSRSVILDGCFYHQKQIEHLINNVDAKSIVFTLKAPIKTCISRDSGRKKVYGADSARAVHDMVSRFDYGIIINTEDKRVEDTVEEILKKFKK